MGLNGTRVKMMAGSISTLLGCAGLANLSLDAMRESPEQAYKHVIRRSVPLFGLKEHQALHENGFVVIDNVLSPDLLESARKEVERMLDTTTELEVLSSEEQEYRQDKVVWLYETICKAHKSATTGALLSAIRCLRSVPFEILSQSHSTLSTSEMSSAALNLGVPLGSQLSCYDGNNSRFLAHRDAPTEESRTMTSWFTQPGLHDRVFTLILYLNTSEWDSNADGLAHNGNLKIFVGTKPDDLVGETATDVVHVEPVGGRLVIMDSKRILHEVLPTTTRRIAIATWVGGSHSHNKWLRYLSVPPNEWSWKELL